MYYCNSCGIVRYLSRPENRETPSEPKVVLFCNFCGSETNYRKVLPEFFDAAHEKGVETMMRDMYKKLTTPISKSDDISLGFLEKENEDKFD